MEKEICACDAKIAGESGEKGEKKTGEEKASWHTRIETEKSNNAREVKEIP